MQGGLVSDVRGGNEGKLETALSAMVRERTPARTADRTFKARRAARLGAARSDVR